VHPETVKTWVEIATSLLTVIGGLVAALWAYTRFVLERGLLAPAQFSIDCTVVGRQNEFKIVEIILRIKNLGSSTLIVGNLRLDLLGLSSSDNPELFDDPVRPTFGRLKFPQRFLRHESSKVALKKERGVCLMAYNTFVQAGVEQLYTFVTAVPSSNSFLLAWASFEYAQHPSTFQHASLWLSRRLGLIQYSLAHVAEPHTAERVFSTNVQTQQ